MAEKLSFRGAGLVGFLIVAFSTAVTIALITLVERQAPPASIRPAEQLVIQPVEQEARPTGIGGGPGGRLVIQPVESEVRKTADVLRVEWLGAWPAGLAPDTSCVDPGFYRGGPPPVQLYDKSKELGFREDGVVVWRACP